ncbi:hypothetical protein BKA64DRAFT_742024 [Cadophora sp. MPI-SDFR-AT-0126]|nr:hypothetical protein BKA64DRAFT_742024 [Leotiomycetes sp. MPI-SDFR-AT-0126]
MSHPTETHRRKRAWECYYSKIHSLAVSDTIPTTTPYFTQAPPTSSLTQNHNQATRCLSSDSVNSGQLHPGSSASCSADKFATTSPIGDKIEIPLAPPLSLASASNPIADWRAPQSPPSRSIVILDLTSSATSTFPMSQPTSISYDNTPPTTIPSPNPTMGATPSSESNTSTPASILPSKRPHASISQSTNSISNDVPISNTRLRRQAAIASRNQVKAQTRPQAKSSRNFKSNSKTKAEGKVKKGKVVQQEEEDDFECPCGAGCETIGDCENAQKEAEVRDVGMSVILTSTGIVNILVGMAPNQQSIPVHKELLAIHSEYFASLFASQGKSTSITSSTSRSETVLEEALTGAMGGTNLGYSVDIKGEVGVKNGGNANVDVKMELVEDDDDDDFTIISSDQYYSKLTKKHCSTSTKPPPPPFITNLIARTAATKHNLTHAPSLTPLPTPLPSSSPPPLRGTTLPSQPTYSLPTIHPLALTLFTSYIYTGTLTHTLLVLSDTADSCTWENLWGLGYKLKAPGFMNYCMEGLRALKRVQEGTWPSPREARKVWEMDLRQGFGQTGTETKIDFKSGTEAQEEDRGSGDSETELSSGPTCGGKPEAAKNHHSTPSLSGQTHEISNRLKLFTSTCIAYLSPLTQHPKTSMQYRNWERTLTSTSKTHASLSLAVHEVDVKRFGEKGKPWDDEFRGMWEVSEVGLKERWRGVVGREVDREGEKGVEMRARKGDVGCALKMMGARGEGWVKGLRWEGGGGESGSGSESEIEGEDGEFGVEGQDGDGEEEDEEYFEGRGGRRKRIRG